MPQPRVLILRAPGTNCDQETARAFELAGGRCERLHVNRLLEEPKLLADFQILCLPGGFSYGDDIGAGRILGSQIEHRLTGVCRLQGGGQIDPGDLQRISDSDEVGHSAGQRRKRAPATLTWNQSGKFEARWVELKAIGTKSVFFAGIDRLELPVAHAEGKFVTRDRAMLDQLEAGSQVVLRYQAGGSDAGGAYPQNPNGATNDIAGICDASGRVCGLMPHPERFVDRTQHPRWTRLAERPAGDGLRVFENAVGYFS